MARMSRQLKEIIQTVAVLLVVAILVVVYAIYPMGRVKASMGRVDIDDYNRDSIPLNDATAYLEAGLAPDTFSIETDGWTTLACLILTPTVDSSNPVAGTAFLLHEETGDRDAMLPLARVLVDSGYAVVVYDQRACGRSTGRFHGDGQLEAGDLQEILSYLDLRERIVHPVVVVGGQLGADAALLASQQEQRIDAVVAMSPYLTTDRMLDVLKVRHGMFWFPFFRTIMWWWYGIRSSYAVDYRQLDDLRAVGCATLLIMTPEALQEREVERLQELSEPGWLDLRTPPTGDSDLYRMILDFTAVARKSDGN